MSLRDELLKKSQRAVEHMGVAKPGHVLTPAATVRRVVNMIAICAVEAQIRAQREG